MDNNDPILKAKSDEVRFEVARLTSLVGLCEERGINPGITLSDIDALVAPFLTEPDELGFIAARNRIGKMHRHLHELLYAPPGR